MPVEQCPVEAPRLKTHTHTERERERERERSSGAHIARESISEWQNCMRAGHIDIHIG